MEKISLFGNRYDLSIDFWPHSVPKIYDTHKYLMKKIESYGS